MSQYAILHHGGNDRDNPVLENLTIQIRLHKQGIDETLRKAWVQVGSSVFCDLTELAVVTRNLITIDVVAGTHLQAGFPAVRNVIHFTTEDHRHSKRIVWVATRPAALITLDGYNCEDATKPFIYPFYAVP